MRCRHRARISGRDSTRFAVALRLIYLRVRVCAVLDGPPNRLQFDLAERPAGDNHRRAELPDIAAAERVEFPSLSLEVAERHPGTRRSRQQRRGDGRRPAALRAPRGSARGPRSLADGRDAPRRARRQRRGRDARRTGDHLRARRRHGHGPGGAVARGHPVRRGKPSRAAGDERVAPRAAGRAAAADAVFNLQRALLFVQALEHGTSALVREALRDQWHQPFRAARAGLRRARAAPSGPARRLPERLGPVGAGALLGRRMKRLPDSMRGCRAAAGARAPFGRCPLTSRGCAHMTYFTGLRCRMCGASYPAEALFACGECLGPLEVTYDYEAIRAAVTPASHRRAPAEPLAVSRAAADCGKPADRFPLGRNAAHPGRPPRAATRRGRTVHQGRLGQPSDVSYKDRVVSVAATRAVELGFTVFACASTGNLANSVSAHAARLGLECYVFIPTTSSRPRCSDPPSTGRTSWPSPATTTT